MTQAEEILNEIIEIKSFFDERKKLPNHLFSNEDVSVTIKTNVSNSTYRLNEVSVLLNSKFPKANITCYPNSLAIQFVGFSVHLTKP